MKINSLQKSAAFVDGNDRVKVNLEKVEFVLALKRVSLHFKCRQKIVCVSFKRGNCGPLFGDQKKSCLLSVSAEVFLNISILKGETRFWYYLVSFLHTKISFM